MGEDPRWPRASEWLGGPLELGKAGGLAVMGVPLHRASITPGRCDLAPGAIREALQRFSTWDPDLGIDLNTLPAANWGDLKVAGESPETAALRIRPDVFSVLLESEAVVLLGGDNSVTRAVLSGVPGSLIEMGERLGDPSAVGLLTLDAHHDLRDTTDGLNNGNPIRALLEDGFPGRNFVQVGIQPFANSKAYANIAKEAGITVVTVDEARRRGVAAVIEEALSELEGRVDTIYVDLDVDVLDRAYAPACPGSRPGGLTPGEVQAAARVAGTNPKVRYLDIVEVDPERDVADVTVLAAASFVLAFAAGVATRLRA